MAYVGTRKLFEDAGFTKAADTRSVTGGQRTGQRRFSRISTRGNPPVTERVSAALVKPASSNSLRVPT